MPSLHLYPKPRLGAGHVIDLTRYAWPTWRRSIRARGGFWMGDFSITHDQMSRDQMWAFYQTGIGRILRERSFGITTWEGEIYEMTLTVGGISYMMTLDPDRWHNKVRVQHTYPRIQDSEQGALAYDPGGTTATFQDAGQDFTEWATDAPGPAVYQCIVTNDDDSTVHFFVGPATTVTNPNDACRTYLDVEMTTMGWNGETAFKTPVSYAISHVERAGVSELTDWAEVADSIAQYGEAQYIDVRGEMLPDVAEGIRDRRLTEHAYPHSIAVGGASSDAGRLAQEDRLDVTCAGFVFSMNRRYMESDTVPDDLSDQVALLVDGSADAAEFVTAGNITANTALQHAIMRADNPQRLWDLCEELVDMGNGADRWIAGVYAGRLLDYGPAETERTYYWRSGRLVNRLGIPIYPTLIRPNIVVEGEAIFGATPSSGNTFDNPRQFYVEEVEFIAPRSYRLIPYEGTALVGGY